MTLGFVQSSSERDMQRMPLEPREEEHLRVRKPPGDRQVFQVCLELTSESWPPCLPRCCASEVSLGCFNDLRTIFLLHDKRMLGVVKHELLGRGPLTGAYIQQ